MPFVGDRAGIMNGGRRSVDGDDDEVVDGAVEDVDG